MAYILRHWHPEQENITSVFSLKKKLRSMIKMVATLGISFNWYWNIDNVDSLFHLHTQHKKLSHYIYW